MILSDRKGHFSYPKPFYIQYLENISTLAGMRIPVNRKS